MRRSGRAPGVPSDRSSSPKGAASAPPSVSRKDRSSTSSPTPIVLPGESLSKYGGAPAEGAPPENAIRHVALPVRSESGFKPSTMIESPIVWDGSGLLPGESLSKHRKRKDEPAPGATSEPQTPPADELDSVRSAPDVIEEKNFVEEITESGHESAPLPETASAKELLAFATKEDDLVEDEPLEEEILEEDDEDEFEETSESALLPGAPDLDSETWESAEREDDATASHNVDPLPPAEFRLFGLGSKKKPDEKTSKKAKTISSSTYAPGRGLIEEETIEEEEFVAPRHPHRPGKAEDVVGPAPLGSSEADAQ